jgi:ankyrin repeat protein
MNEDDSAQLKNTQYIYNSRKKSDVMMTSKSEDYENESSEDLNDLHIIQPHPSSNEKMIFDLMESDNNSAIVSTIDKLLQTYKLSEIMSQQGMSLLHVACQNNNLEVVEYLLKSSSNCDNESISNMVNLKCRDSNLGFAPIHFC